MTLRVYDYTCPKCGFKKESFEPVYTDTVDIDCVTDETLACRLDRVTANLPRYVKIDVEAKAFVPSHVKRARNLGHGGSNSKTEGRYDNDDPKNFKKKIMVGP